MKETEYGREAEEMGVGNRDKIRRGLGRYNRREGRGDGGCGGGTEMR